MSNAELIKKYCKTGNTHFYLNYQKVILFYYKD